MRSSYATWMGQAVVLQVSTADLRVPLRGMIVGESSDALRVRIAENWDVDIFKNMILGVQEDACADIAEFVSFAA
jgi:hypothetical protein